MPLRLGVLSKFERGDALVRDRLGRAAKAEPVPLEPGMSASAAFRAVAYACLRQMRLNETVLLGGRDVEACTSCGCPCVACARPSRCSAP